MNELRRGFVRILRGISSRIEESVRRCEIRLHKGLGQAEGSSSKNVRETKHLPRGAEVCLLVRAQEGARQAKSAETRIPPAGGRGI
jgi:hypothetical protein